MTISFSGLGSGMDYSSWIDQLVEIKMEAVTKLKTQKTTLTTKQNTLNTVKSTFNTLRTSIQTISDSKYGGTMDIFGSNTTSSTNSKYVTATATNNAARQDLSIFVKQLATTTTATGNNVAGKEIDENTVFAELINGSAKTGTFSIYVDSKKYEIEIDEDSTIGDIKQSLELIDGVNVKIDDGRLSINSNHSLSLGSNADTSNFVTVMGLTEYEESTNSYTSTHTITEINDSAKLLDSNSGFAEGLTAGTFTIGTETFTIDENTTLKSLINTINKSTNAGVKATFDYTTGKLSLNSTSTGSMNINIEAGTSNITDILGFTDNGKIISGTQQNGQNAKFILNGTEFTSFSNKVTSDVTGLTGVTLNLNAAMTDNEEYTTVSIKQDTDKIYNQIAQMINDLNAVITQVDSTTAADADNVGALAYETQLTSLRNNLRTAILQGQTLSDGTYTSLASIGISTGELGSGIDSDTNQLVIDEKTLREALETDPQKVKELLIGTNASDTNGAVNKMYNIVSSALDSQYGYFATKSNTLSTQINNIDNKIETKTAQAESYRSKLERQFKAMDTAIAKLQQQYNGLDFSS